ncbi:MAG: fatty acid desaturase [Pseudomonadota bacterium]|nr:fatty acid desaturase [Pseudomonadota bacterium]
MRSEPVDLSGLDPQRKAQFRALTSAPDVAWPTVILCGILVVSYVSVYASAGLGLMPLWVGMLINAAVGYVSFSVAHDSIHRAISKNAKLNDFVGQLGMTMVLPFVDLRLFRWAHIQHHRFANGARDPDKHFKGTGWTLPFRWMVIDAVYFVHSLKNGDKVSAGPFRASLVRGAIFVALLAVLTWAGFGMEILMLWFLPSRLILLALGFSFFWLPHVPHDVTQADHFTRATTVREGYEAFFAPVLQHQNFHLIHHLYPMTPFYNNGKVFHLIAPELRQYELAVQKGFAIYPEIRPGKRAGT